MSTVDTEHARELTAEQIRQAWSELDLDYVRDITRLHLSSARARLQADHARARAERDWLRTLLDRLMDFNPCGGAEEPYERHRQVCVPFFEARNDALDDLGPKRP